MDRHGHRSSRWTCIFMRISGVMAMSFTNTNLLKDLKTCSHLQDNNYHIEAILSINLTNMSVISPKRDEKQKGFSELINVKFREKKFRNLLCLMNMCQPSVAVCFSNFVYQISRLHKSPTNSQMYPKIHS
ncbi:hypothetical protein Tcan_01017, partial [Toxocara canis]